MLCDIFILHEILLFARAREGHVYDKNLQINIQLKLVNF